MQIKKTRILFCVLSIICLIGFTAYSQPTDKILAHSTGGNGIWVMNPDGTDLTEVSDFGWFGEFSRGGLKIAFGEYYFNGIWTMDADGSNQMNLTSSGNDPSWSPDGTQLVYVTGDTSAVNRRLWVINADGSGNVQLTNFPSDNPDWSHYSNKIVFEVYGGSSYGMEDGIYTINADGSGLERISYGRWPSWSPDDSKILYSSNYIYTMNPDGSNPTKVSLSSGYNSSMGDDGRIVFQSGNSLIIINTDGTETVISSSGLAAPDWCGGIPGVPYKLSMVFSGVGLIPASEIVDGYATTDPGYILHVENAPFGSRIQVIGNFDIARQYNVARYKIQAAKWSDLSTPPGSADYEDLSEGWGNYLLDPVQNKFVYHSIAPDSNNTYAIPPASEFWMIKHLLIEWDTRRFQDGKYSLKLRAYRGNGTEMNVPPNVNDLTLMVDNTIPKATIDEIRYLRVPVNACDIITISPKAPLDFVISAEDTAGHLYQYRLRALWGENLSRILEMETYDPAVHGLLWTGVSGHLVSKNGFTDSCAYTFQLQAWGRSTNGYSPHIHHSDEYTKSFTIIVSP